MSNEAARAALSRAEQEWTRAWGAKENTLLMSFFAEDAVLLQSAGGTTAGRDAVREFIARVFALPGFSTRLQTHRLEVSGSGDLGYALGSYESRVGEAGKTLVHNGHYVTVWKKHTDGTWRVAVHSSSAVAGK